MAEACLQIQLHVSVSERAKMHGVSEVSVLEMSWFWVGIFTQTPWRIHKNETSNSGLYYSYGVDYRALRRVYFLDPPTGLGSLGASEEGGTGLILADVDLTVSDPRFRPCRGKYPLITGP